MQHRFRALTPLTINGRDIAPGDEFSSREDWLLDAGLVAVVEKQTKKSKTTTAKDVQADEQPKDDV